MIRFSKLLGYVSSSYDENIEYALDMCCSARSKLSQNQLHIGAHRLDNFHSIRSEIPSCPRIVPYCRIGAMWS